MEYTRKKRKKKSYTKLWHVDVFAPRYPCLNRYIHKRWVICKHTDHISENQRKTCLRVGGPIRDVTRLPGPNPHNHPIAPMAEGVGDRAMMTELFTFAFDFDPPNLVILASGDRDFSTPLRAIKDMGFTTILICNLLSTPQYLLGSANYVYDWNMILRDGLSSGPSEPPEILPCLERALNFKKEIVVMWDMDTIALPGFSKERVLGGIVS